MKSGWKIFWIIIAVITALGVIGGCIALASGVSMEDFENDFTVHEDTVIVEEEMVDFSKDGAELYEFQDITDLAISVGACEVVIQESDTDMVQVDASHLQYQKLGLELYVEDDNGTLVIQTRKNGNLWDVLSAKNRNGGVLKIYIPENMNLHSLYAEVGAGEMEYSGTISGNVEIVCGAGEVDLHLHGREDDFNYELSVGIGEIEIGEKEYGGLAMDKTIDNRAEKDMIIQCGAGSVSVDFK